MATRTAFKSIRLFESNHLARSSSTLLRVPIARRWCDCAPELELRHTSWRKIHCLQTRTRPNMILDKFSNFAGLIYRVALCTKRAALAVLSLDRGEHDEFMARIRRPRRHGRDEKSVLESNEPEHDSFSGLVQVQANNKQ